MSDKSQNQEKQLPEKWQKSAKALRAVQVAFDMDEKIQYAIRLQALNAGTSPSDQIRRLLELPTSRRPKRPRLTVSLTGEDYQTLGERFGIDPSDQLAIKRRVMEELAAAIETEAETDNTPD